MVLYHQIVAHQKALPQHFFNAAAELFLRPAAHKMDV
jgi:hypothetical protein